MVVADESKHIASVGSSPELPIPLSKTQPNHQSRLRGSRPAIPPLLSVVLGRTHGKPSSTTVRTSSSSKLKLHTELLDVPNVRNHDGVAARFGEPTRHEQVLSSVEPING